MRWRLAAVSAGLTLVILLIFAAVIGSLTSDRIRSDFRNDVRNTATDVAFRFGANPKQLENPEEFAAMAPGDAAIRIFDQNEQVVAATQPDLELGPPRPEVTEVGGYQVATGQVALVVDRGSRLLPESQPQVYSVQYARPIADVQETVDRLWLFLFAGVALGTVLAALAGIVVANRAMRPIASLTATARRIASTRDPSQRVPQPEADDEVGELARTLDEMLRELDAARTETEQAMRRQREFVADASHELRTPLTSILANLELLQAELDGPDGGDGGAAASSALRSSRRMSRLVGDLLLLARADAGRIGDREDCDLAGIATEALAEVGPVAGERELRIDSEGPVRVHGSPDELHRMVLNLLENAVRHTPEGTAVEVRTGTDGDAATLQVDDTGPGLPPGTEDQVFERFVRGVGPADTSPNGGGTGLGLAIVRAVATSHGGQVAAGSSPDGGARFTVRLPRADHGDHQRQRPALTSHEPS